MPASILDGFEYADIAALEAAGWQLTDTMGGGSAVSISSTEAVEGETSLRIAVTGSLSAGLDCYYERTFTGLGVSTRYEASVWVWENVEMQGSAGIACGIEVEGGSAVYVEQNGAVGFWQQFIAAGTTNASGELTVRVGFYHTINASHNRVAYFDDLQVTPGNPWDDVLLDSGVLTVGGAVVGYTQGGGFKLEVERKFVQYEVEGVPVAVEGLDLLTGISAKLGGSIITADDKSLAVIETGAAEDEDAAELTTRYTPVPALTALAAGQYLTDVRCTWRKAGGGFLRVWFPKAICTRYGVTGKDKAEGQISCEIEARAASSATLTAAPYFIDLIAPDTAS